MRTSKLLCGGIVIFSVGAPQATESQTPPVPSRPLRVDDLFTIETLGDVRPSPDGRWLAVVRSRPRSPTDQHGRAGLLSREGLALTDIWLVSTRGGDARPLTAEREGAGAGHPVWSPDGSRLALLSTAGGDNVRLYGWSMHETAPVRLAEPGVDLQARFVAPDGTQLGRLAWLDATRVAAVLLSPSEVPLQFDLELRAQRRVTAAWPRALRGLEPTASVLETEEPDREPAQVALVTVEVTRRQVDTIALLPGGRDLRRIVLAPDRRSAAVIAALERPRPRPGLSIGLSLTGRDRLGLVALHPGAAVRWVATVKPTAVQWSPDGRRLAVQGTPLGEDGPDRAFVVEAATGAVHQVSAEDQAVTAFVWAGPHRLVVRAAKSAETRRADWWRYDLQRSAAAPTNLTATLTEAPGALVPLGAAGTLLGLASGALWRVEPAAKLAERLTETTSGRVAELRRLSDPAAVDAGLRPSLVVRRERGGASALERVVMTRSGVRLEPVPLPHPGAELLVDRPAQRLAVFSSGMMDLGPVLWTSDGRGERATRVLALNAQLAEITRGERRLIDYIGADGDSLKAVLLLPVGYQPGRRYPLVTWVYGGSVYSDTLESVLDVTNPGAFNLQLLATQGYAVLLPSIPLGPAGAAVRSDPYLEIPKGVLPAVDQIVALGIADPARLAVMGQSFGGYTTYVLATYTNRFKAAIASAGPSDLISIYGTFDARQRYEPWPHRNLSMAAALEERWGQMGVPPYDDVVRYLRNSPVVYAERIGTPLLIIQGDLDFVPIQQGEEMFTALFRLGKPGRFVRYWGEGHVVDSPANVRHMWGEIFAWLDRYLGAADSARSEPSQ